MFSMLVPLDASKNIYWFNRETYFKLTRSGKNEFITRAFPRNDFL